MNIFSKITLQNLRKNRTRTAVTIIGIALSAALFTAVTCSVSTLMHFIQNYESYNYGSWYGAGYTLSDEQLSALNAESDVEKITAIQSMGFAALTDCANEYKPYLFVGGVTEDCTDLLPIHLTEGRMPENSSELLLPEHLASNGQIQYEIGDVLTLSLCYRDSDGYILDNHDAYVFVPVESAESMEDGTSEIIPAETLVPTSVRTYTVTGFYQRPSFEDYSAPGYTALTIADTDTAAYTCDVYFTLKNGYKTSKFMFDHDALFPGGWAENTNYLRTIGYSGEAGFNAVLSGLAAILIGIIMFGSITLIYNAFSISVSERTRQFGILSSIGATRRQLRRSVLTEGLFLALIGIPLGLVVGLLGIGITFHFVGEMIISILSITEISLTFHPSLAALLISVLVSLFTILVSAYIPARRATRISAIEAIRQSNDVRIRAKHVRTGKLTQKLFGFEGMIAAKNFKRNRKSYRATVLSLFVSIVLFVSANNLCAYLTSSVGSVYEDVNYDVQNSITFNGNPDTAELDRLSQDFSGLSGVTDLSYQFSLISYVAINKEAADPDWQKDTAWIYEEAFSETDPDSALITAKLLFVEDDTFRQILADNRLPEEEYFDASAPKALCINRIKNYVSDDKRYHIYEPIASFEEARLRIALDSDVYDEDGNYTGRSYEFFPFDCDTAISAPDIPVDSGTASFYLLFYLPYSSADWLFENMESEQYASILSERTISWCIQSASHSETLAELETYMKNHDLDSGWYATYDYVEEMESERTIIFIINVFSYGFIILISLIAVANVFNTISTNVQLRRREFAMLRSVGMTSGGFRKMMNFECLLYGCKSLLYGLPVSVLITWLIFRVINEGIVMDFFLSWQSLVIAVGSVFAVVFTTMLYSMNKISKENTVEALKNENI